jgi:hypothetical protein
MAPISELSSDQLSYLTEIDYWDHMAWVALDPTQPGQPGMGVARYVRMADDPAAAQAAVAVVDEHQGAGSARSSWRCWRSPHARPGS